MSEELKRHSLTELVNEKQDSKQTTPTTEEKPIQQNTIQQSETSEPVKKHRLTDLATSEKSNQSNNGKSFNGDAQTEYKSTGGTTKDSNSKLDDFYTKRNEANGQKSVGSFSNININAIDKTNMDTTAKQTILARVAGNQIATMGPSQEQISNNPNKGGGLILGAAGALEGSIGAAANTVASIGSLMNAKYEGTLEKSTPKQDAYAVDSLATMPSNVKSEVEQAKNNTTLVTPKTGKLLSKIKAFNEENPISGADYVRASKPTDMMIGGFGANPNIQYSKENNAKLQKFADDVAGLSSATLEDAKKTLAKQIGNEKIAKVIIDLEANAIQMGVDAVTGSAFGLTMMAPMMFRSYGSSEMSARQNGASQLEAAKYATLASFTEYCTEKMWSLGTTMSKLAGKGMLDDASEAALTSFAGKLSRKVAKTEAGQQIVYNLTKLFPEMATEAIEEMTADVFDTAFEYALFNKDAKLDINEMLYDGLIGGLIGGLGGIAGQASDHIQGKDLAKNSNIQHLVDIAISMPSDTTAYKIGSKVQNSIDSNGTIIYSELSDLLKSVMESSDIDPDSFTEALVKAIENGESANSAEAQANEIEAEIKEAGTPTVSETPYKEDTAPKSDKTYDAYTLTGIQRGSENAEQRIADKVESRIKDVNDILQKGDNITTDDRRKLDSTSKLIKSILLGEENIPVDKGVLAKAHNDIVNVIGGEPIDVTQFAPKVEEKKPEHFNADAYAKAQGIENWRELAKQYLGGYTIDDYDSEEHFSKFLFDLTTKQNLIEIAEAEKKRAEETKNPQTEEIPTQTETTSETVENQPEIKAEEQTEPKSDVTSNAPTDVDVATDDVTEAQGKANTTGEAQDVKVSDYKAETDSTSEAPSATQDEVKAESVETQDEATTPESEDTENKVKSALKYITDYAKTLSRKHSEETYWYKTVTNEKVYKNYLDAATSYVKAMNGYYHLGLFGEEFDYNIDKDSRYSQQFDFHEDDAFSLSEKDARLAYEAGVRDRLSLEVKAKHDDAPIHYGDSRSMLERIIEPDAFYYGMNSDANRETYGDAKTTPYNLIDIINYGNDLYFRFRDMPIFDNGREFYAKVDNYMDYSAQDIIDSVDSAYGSKTLGAIFRTAVKDYYKKYVDKTTDNKNPTSKSSSDTKQPKNTTNPLTPESKSSNNSQKEKGNNEQQPNQGLHPISESGSVQPAETEGNTGVQGETVAEQTVQQGSGHQGQAGGTVGADGGVQESTTDGLPGINENDNAATSDSRGNGESRSGRDNKGFVIENLPILKKSKTARFDANIKAIETLKKIQDEGRTTATPEEMEVLANFTGWGGLKNIFNSKTKADIERSNQLKDLIGKEAYNTAMQNGTMTAFYTPVEVAKTIYSVVKRMGFANGKILEPSCGTGIFLGTMPESMRDNGITAVELDSVSGNIAKLLYPNADVTVSGFEKLNAPRESLDLIVGNIPFSKNFPVYDENFQYGKKPQDIHDFFVLKGLDLLKPNGVMAVLAPTSIMDEGSGTTVGSLIKEKANLITAFRLPAGTFGNTETVCDLIILQKKSKSGYSVGTEFPSTAKLEVDGTNKTVSKFWIDNPNNVIGNFAIKSFGESRKDLIVEDNGRSIDEIVDMVPKNIISNAKQYEAQQQDADTTKALTNDEAFGKPTGTYIVKDGELYTVDGGELSRPFKMLQAKVDVLDDEGNQTFEDGKVVQERKKSYIQKGSKDYKRAIALTEIANAHIELARAQETFEEDADLQEYRDRLNKLYDDYTKNFKNSKKELGRIRDGASKAVFDGDARYSMICALEQVKEVNGKKVYSKSDVFTKRTVNAVRNITSAETALDALFASININGGIDLEYMSELYGKSKEDILNELSNTVFEVPSLDENATYVMAEEYLSGDVKSKLEEAKAMNEAYKEKYGVENKYENQIKALESVIPKDIGAGDIKVQLGAAWIDEDTIADFAYDICGIEPDGSIKVTYDPTFSIWNVNTTRKSAAKWGAKGTSKDVDGIDILNAVLNHRRIELSISNPGGKAIPDTKGMENVQAKMDEMSEYFDSWAKKDGDRMYELVKLYNERMNRTVLRKFDTFMGRENSFMNMPGSAINLRKHQMNAVYRMLTTVSTLLNHGVGAGKTFAMIGAAHEMKRLGMANKPLMVVPNHKLADFVSDWYRMYPTANILAIDSATWTESVRKKLLESIATNDYDCIIMRHSSFEKMPFTPEFEEEFYQERIDEANLALETAIANGVSERKLSGLKKRVQHYEAKLGELRSRSNKRADNVVAFDNSGIDAIFVDEAHNYKNLENFTSMDRIAGVSTGDAQKTYKMLMATKRIHQINGKVVFATATPISNTMGEMYNMFRYLRPDLLEKYYMKSFDAFAGNFGNVVTRFEPNTTGTGIVAKQRFSKFVNIPELVKGFAEFTDTLTIDDIVANDPTFKIPKAELRHVTSESSELLDMFNEYIESEKERIKGMKPDELKAEGINSLLLYQDAKAAALDLRLVMKILQNKGYLPSTLSPSALDFKGSKINKVVDNVFEEYKNSSDRSGTQLIFLDRGTPNKSVFTPQKQAQLEALLVKQEECEANGEELSANDKKKLDKLLEEQDGARYDFNLYEDIKRKLVAMGIPESEIAFIQDTQGSNSDKKKEALFEKVRSGNVRILLGSTSMMGEGMNVQEKVVAIHHVDAPFRPSDVEQRNGRGIRQGNENDLVRIYMYSTENSYDAAMWNILDTKNKFISSVLHGDPTEREFEDLGTDDFANMSVEAANNPKMQRLAEVKAEIKKLETEQRNAENEAIQYQHVIREFDSTRVNLEQRIAIFESAVSVLKDNPSNDVTIDGEVYDSLQAASNALLPIAQSLKVGESKVVGKFHGFDIVLTNDSKYEKGRYTLSIDGMGPKEFEPKPIQLTKENGGMYDAGDADLNYPLSSVFLRLNNSLNGTKNSGGIEDKLINSKKALQYQQKRYDEAVANVKDAGFKNGELLAKDKAERDSLIKELGESGSRHATNPFVQGLDMETIIEEEHQRRESAHPKSSQKKSTSEDVELMADVSTSDKVKAAMEKGKAKQKEKKAKNAVKGPRQVSTGQLYSPKAQPKTSTAEIVKNTNDIIKIISKVFNVPIIRAGNFKKRKALGYYIPDRGQIRIKGFNDIIVTLHEVGHKLDHLYDFSTRFENELQKIGDKFEEQVANSYQNDPEKLRKEAFAEIFRLYITNPAGANEFDNGIGFIKKMEETLSKEDAAKIKQIAELSQTYLNADPTKKAEASIKSRNDKPEDYRTFGEKVIALKAKVIEEFTALEEMNKKIGRLSGKYIKPKDNAFLKAQNARTADAKAYGIMTNRLVAPNSDIGIDKPFLELLVPVRDNLKAFKAYLKNEHAIEWWNQGKQVYERSLDNIDTMLQMKATWESEHPEFIEAAQSIYDWFEKFERIWLVDTGMVDEDLFNKFRALNPKYVSNARVIEGKDGNLRRDKFGDSNQFMFAKGSDYDTYDPIETMIYDINRIVQSEMNREVFKSMRDMFYDPETAEAMSMFIAKYEPGTKKNTFDAEPVKAQLESELSSVLRSKMTVEEAEQYYADKADPKVKEELDAKYGITDVTQTIEDLVDDYIDYYTADYTSERKDVFRVKTGDTIEMFVAVEPALVDMLYSMRNKHEMAGALKMLSQMKRTMTVLTTGANPLFAVMSNPWRDAPLSYIKGSEGNPLKFIRDWGRAVFDIVRNTERYKAYKSAGVGFESAVSEDMSYMLNAMAKANGYKPKNFRDGVEHGLGLLKEAAKTYKTQGVRKGTENVGKLLFGPLVRAVEALNNTMESSFRLAEYTRSKEQLLNNGMDEASATIVATRRSNENTTDFTRRGNSEEVNDAAACVPYLKAGINGLTDVYNAYRGKGAKYEGMSESEKQKTIRETWIKSVVALTIPTIILAWLHRDDDEYDKLPDYYKNGYWIFNKEWFGGPKGEFYRIPKPQEIGWLFSTTFDIAIRAILGQEDDAGEALIESFMDEVVPSYNTILAPWFDAGANKTWSGNQIVSSVYDDLMEAGGNNKNGVVGIFDKSYSSYYDDIYDDTTSKIAILLAKLIPDSPMAGARNTPKGIQYMLQQYTGVIGQFVLPATTPSKGMYGALSGVADRVTADTTYSNRYTNEYYSLKATTAGDKDKYERGRKNKYDENTYNLFNDTSDSAVQNLKNAGVKIPSGGKLEELAAYKDVSPETGKITYGISPNKRLSQLWKLIRETNNNSALSREKREELLKGYHEEINAITQEMVEVYNAYEDGERGTKKKHESLDALDTLVKDSDGGEHQLSYNQYTKMMNTYESKYYEYTSKYPDYELSKEDKARYKEEAREYARVEAKNSAVNGLITTHDKYEGLDVKDVLTYLSILKNFDADGNGSYKQPEVISAIRSMEAQGLDGHSCYLLFRAQNSGWIPNERNNNPWYYYR